MVVFVGMVLSKEVVLSKFLGIMGSGWFFFKIKVSFIWDRKFIKYGWKKKKKRKS